MVSLRYHNSCYPLYVFIIDNYSWRYHARTNRKTSNGKIGYGVCSDPYETYYSRYIKERPGYLENLEWL
jgi:hypothetical protein